MGDFEGAATMSFREIGERVDAWLDKYHPLVRFCFKPMYKRLLSKGYSIPMANIRVRMVSGGGHLFVLSFLPYLLGTFAEPGSWYFSVPWEKIAFSTAVVLIVLTICGVWDALRNEKSK